MRWWSDVRRGDDVSGSPWGPAGPPDEAYSRVTNPERFAILHAAAVELLDRLEAEFDVERSEGRETDVGSGMGTPARPSVTLRPKSGEAAPLTIRFTTFPGLIVHVGRRYSEPLPQCGCDACAETGEEMVERLEWLVGHVVAGRLREAIEMPRFGGDAWQVTEIGDMGAPPWQRSRGAIERERAREIVAGDRAEHAWRAWPRRDG
jgi:hypothetical protein